MIFQDKSLFIPVLLTLSFVSLFTPSVFTCPQKGDETASKNNRANAVVIYDYFSIIHLNYPYNN